jgi:hypothetical protein
MRDGKLKIQPVKIARRMKDRVLLHVEPEGIQPGDKVVTSPLAVAEDGMALQEQATTEATTTAAGKP